MVEEKKDEREKDKVLLKEDQKGFGVGALKATGLGVSLFDPINIAASFIPVFGQGKICRTCCTTRFYYRARLARGVTEGDVCAAIIEPIVYGLAKEYKLIMV